MRKINILGLIIVTIISLQFNLVKAQWNYTNIGFDNVIITTNTPTVNAVGIGPFTTALQAALHINGLILPTANNFTSGHLFRTDGPSNADNIWEMWTGATPTPMAALFVPANSNNFTLQASAKLGSMIFNTTDSLGGSYEHMRITGKTGSQEGYVLVTHNGYTGVGDFDPNTVFRVVGDSLGGWYNDIVKVAEFRRDSSNRQETAINIRGQRNTLNSLQIPPSNVASILLSNFN